MIAEHTARAPVLADAESIAELVQSYSRSITGIVDYTVADARDQLTEPGFDPEHDARLVLDAGDNPVGFATIIGRSDSDEFEIDVVAAEPDVSQWLFAWAHERAQEQARRHGHQKITLEHGVYRADEGLRTQLTALGYHPVTTFHRMRIDHANPAPPPLPEGVTLRQDARQAAHDVLNASFAEHFGFVPETYEHWHDKLDGRSTFDWSQLWLAEADGQPAGVLICNDQFVEDENCGHVPHLGVLPAARGRGIAKFLLRHAFAIDARAGRTGTILHVDSNNTTPALGLYQSVGMRPVLVIDVWRLTAVCEA